MKNNLKKSVIFIVGLIIETVLYFLAKVEAANVLPGDDPVGVVGTIMAVVFLIWIAKLIEE